jgi:hypothetical protein
MLHPVRLVLAGLLGILSAYVSVFNWIALVKRLTSPRGPSWIPLIGGALGVVALLVEPTGTGLRWLWLPFLIDAGSLPGLGLTMILYLVYRKNTG